MSEVSIGSLIEGTINGPVIDCPANISCCRYVGTRTTPGVTTFGGDVGYGNEYNETHYWGGPTADEGPLSYFNASGGVSVLQTNGSLVWLPDCPTGTIAVNRAYRPQRLHNAGTSQRLVVGFWTTALLVAGCVGVVLSV